MDRKVTLFDFDGCMRLPCAGRKPTPPPRPLGNIFHGLRRSNCAVAGATGSSKHWAEATEHDLNFRFDVLSPSHCTRLFQRRETGGRRQFTLVPAEEQVVVERLNPVLDDIRRRHKGVLDDRGPCYTKFLPCERTFDAASEEVAQVVADVRGVRFMAHRYDRGITVVAASASKQQAVDWLHAHGYRIVVAAGDTKSDLPLAYAAEYFIVTLTDEVSEPCPQLVEVVNRTGRGYIATRPHGFGLIDGLYAARAAGVITF